MDKSNRLLSGSVQVQVLPGAPYGISAAPELHHQPALPPDRPCHYRMGGREGEWDGSSKGQSSVALVAKLVKAGDF